jgi:hypothetical protein
MNNEFFFFFFKKTNNLRMCIIMIRIMLLETGPVADLTKV